MKQNLHLVAIYSHGRHEKKLPFLFQSFQALCSHLSCWQQMRNQKEKKDEGDNRAAFSIVTFQQQGWFYLENLFWGQFACSPCVFVGSLWVLLLPPQSKNMLVIRLRV